MKRSANLIGLPALLLVAVFGVLLSGCNQAVPWGLADDTYYTSVTKTGEWQYRYNGNVNTEIDPDGTINLYCVAGANNTRPDVKVTGKGHFKVHSCNNLKVESGAIVDAFDVSTVKAMPNTTVNAHNTTLVRAATGATVVPHGSTKVEQVSMEQPAEKK